MSPRPLLPSLVLGLMVTAPLFAGVIKYVHREDDEIFDTSPTFLPLNQADATEIPFKNNGGEKLVAITFSAECAVAGSLSQWLGIDILVDGVVIDPTNSDDAFCSGNGTDGFDGWVTASRTVAVKLEAGQHKVRIGARLNGAASGWIGDSSLTIIN